MLIGNFTPNYYMVSLSTYQHSSSAAAIATTGTTITTTR